MKRSTIWDNRFLRIVVSAIFWLAVWQTVSLCVPKILFASPLNTATALLRLSGQAEFWQSVITTLSMTAFGFVLAFAFGSLCAVLCFRSALLRTLLEPAVQIMKSVPVACFVVAALIFISSGYISLLVSFFVVFPVSYVSLLTGLAGLDPSLGEMVRVFRVPLSQRIRQVYLPQLLPGILAGCRLSVGMCLKASIAGEIIGLPTHSIGEKLYLAKLYLSTDELFAWTIVIICVSLLLEKLLVRLLQKMQRKLEVCHGNSAA